MIYICIPSHNEERTVGVLLWKIRQVMAGFPRDYQVLVLDDASTDDTIRVLAPYGRILPLVLLRHERRRGYAASLDELLREATRRSEYPRRDVIVTLQADFTEEPAHIPELLKRIESGADVVTTRAELDPGVPRRVRWTRRILARVVRRLGWPEAVSDALSGFRAYRVLGVRKALEARGGARLVPWSDVWAANAALLREVQPHVRRVDEVPVRLRLDRRQRPSRFEWTAKIQILRLAFGRAAPDLVPPRDGGPVLVPVAPSVVAERGAARNGHPNGRPRRARVGAAAGRRSATPRAVAGAEEAARRTAPARRAAAEGAAGNGSSRRAGQGNGGAGEGRAAAVAPTEALAAEGLAADAVAAEAARARRPRRRRKAPSDGAVAAPAPRAEAEAAAVSAEGAGSGASPQDEGEGGAPARPRRPRRRGGRGRSRGRRAEAGAPDAASGGAEAAPLGERADAPAAGAPGEGV